MRATYLEKRDTEKQQFRFYRIIITQTLFGLWDLIREWGRIGSPGTVREASHGSEPEALEAGEKLMKQKTTRRGYRLIFCNSADAIL
jgi:predicted DNA-binding WGR domain protein